MREEGIKTVPGHQGTRGRTTRNLFIFSPRGLGNEAPVRSGSWKPVKGRIG